MIFVFNRSSFFLRHVDKLYFKLCMNFMKRKEIFIYTIFDIIDINK